MSGEVPGTAVNLIEGVYQHSTGPIYGVFLAGLGVARLLGRTCVACRRVTIPPSEACSACGHLDGTWIDVGPHGTVTAVTRTHDDDGRPERTVLLVKLDGAGTNLVHLGLEPTLRTGDRVEPRWEDEPTGSILDLVGFVAASGPAPDPVTDGFPEERVETTPARLDLRYEQTVAEHEIDFRAALTRGEIVGSRCIDCGLTYVPPRNSCPQCWAPCSGRTTVADRGVVETFVVVNVAFQGQEIDIPYVLAHIRLDGADVPIHHLVGTVGEDGRVEVPEGIRPGMRVAAVWRDAENRRGLLNDDIDHFRPIEEQRR